MTGRVGRIARRPAVSLLVAGLVLAGLGVTADLTAPAPEPAAATVPTPADARPAVEVARADAACPDPAVDDRTASRVTVAAPGATGARRRGRSRLRPAGPGWPSSPAYRCRRPT